MDTTHPEYMTPRELTDLLGHSENFWREALDKGRVTGHRSGRRRHARTGKVVGQRQIQVASARRYLLGLDTGGVVARPAATARDAARQIGAAFRARLRAEGR